SCRSPLQSSKETCSTQRFLSPARYVRPHIAEPVLDDGVLNQVYSQISAEAAKAWRPVKAAEKYDYITAVIVNGEAKVGETQSGEFLKSDFHRKEASARYCLSGQWLC